MHSPIPSRGVAKRAATSIVADERGTTTTSYVLLLCLIAIVAYATWSRLGTTVRARASAAERMIAELDTPPGSSGERSAPGAGGAAEGSLVARTAPDSALDARSAAGATATIAAGITASSGPAAGTTASAAAAGTTASAAAARSASGGAAAGVVSELLAGAIAGDYGEGSSWARTTGQVAVSLVPVVGQVADVRDLSAAVRSYRNGEQGAGVGVAMAAVGFVPGVGDAIKALFRGGRAAREAAPPVVAATRRAADGTVWEGSFARVTLDGDEVVKEIKDELVSPRTNHRVPLTQADRTLMANVTTDISNALRHDEELAQVIVETRVTGPGQMRQRYVGGETLDEVRARDPGLATALDHEAQELVELASERLDGVMESRPDPAPGWIIGIDDNRANFRVVDDQLVWFDPVYTIPMARD